MTTDATPVATHSNPFQVTITAIDCQSKISLSTAISNANVAWASSGTYSVATGSAYATTASSTRCPLTYEFRKSGTLYNPAWETFSTSTGNLQISLATEFVEAAVLTIHITSTNSATLDTAAFSIAVCKPLVLTTITPTFTYSIPNSAGGRVNVIAHAAYATTVGCPITYSLLKQSDNSAATSPWLAVDAAGQVTVDGDSINSEAIYIRMVYNGANHDSSVFTVTVGCAAITLNTISDGTSYTVPSSTAAAVTHAAGSAYLTSTSTLLVCAITYSVVLNSDNSALGGTWLTTNAAGDIQLDKNVLGTQVVKIKYVRAGATAYTNSFTITVACPAITLSTITTPSAHTVPNTGGTTTAQVVAGSAWISSSNLAGVCLPTYSVIKVSTNVALTGSFVTVGATGDVTVNVVTLGDETLLIRYSQANSAGG